MRIHRKSVSILIATASVGFFNGCATNEPKEPLPLADVQGFSTDSYGVALQDRWWTAFEDRSLNAAVERALLGNFTLRSAFERMQAARALARGQSAELWPEVNLTARGEESEVLTSNSRERDASVSAGLTANYELDIWGRVNALAEAEALRAEAAEAFMETAAITLSSEVALAWYRLAGAEEQKRVLLEQIETNRTVLELIEARFKSGQIRAADVLRQRQFVEATVEEANDVSARIALLEHLLAILQGRPPQEAEAFSGAKLVTLPAMPEVGLPTELLQRRPDVREAFLALQASDAELAAAISDRYPRIHLSASLLTSNENELSLFDDWIATMAGQIIAPIFDGGARRAEVARSRALLRQQLAEYGQTVLQAFREVEDALAREYYQKLKIQQLEMQLELADETYRQLRTQYLNGVTDYIGVLDALREQQFLARDLVVARLNLIEFRVALHRALAGGFYEELNTEQSQEKAQADDV